MWTRFVERLRCPVSGRPLRLVSFREEQLNVNAGDAQSYVTAGVLLSDAGWMYPIANGVPILLPYATAIHERFSREHASALRAVEGHRFAQQEPAPGERDVFRSFSEEWREYQYDGVLWDVNYEDNLARLVEEVGLSREEWRGRSWLEVGCGIGMTTRQAQQLSGADAVGVDLSMAVFKAASQFKSNPFLHFVQASAFALPFAPQSFDVVYSRGVLHHTYSTRGAFLSMAKVARPGGRIYLWVYGPGSIAASPLRLGAYAAEMALRPVLSRLPTPVASAVLTPIAAGYIGFNLFRRWRQSEVQPYTFSRALHAARDRFTPRFAHRQSAATVKQWFQEAGCRNVEAVDPSTIPAADRDDYTRNTGVRGTAS
jgi:SAM-dependent methyltransferase